tara:strand:- start:30 stop:623 length:594 start_codon:yes stop_codon:yes gene_type:complete
MPRKKKWTDELVKEMLDNTSSIRQASIEYSVPYSTLVRRAKKLGYKPDAGWNRGKTYNGRPTIDGECTVADKLQANSSLSTGHIKKYALQAGLLEDKCSQCGIYEWNGKEIVLELDHINGINNDHRLDNIRLLCPNCHSQTSTWRGKNNTGKIKVSDEDLLEAIFTTKNYRQALMKVGLTPKGGNYNRCKALMKRVQ